MKSVLIQEICKCWSSKLGIVLNIQIFNTYKYLEKSNTNKRFGGFISYYRLLFSPKSPWAAILTSITCIISLCEMTNDNGNNHLWVAGRLK